MQPHAFQPTAAGSSLCGYPGCLSPRLALIHATQPPSELAAATLGPAAVGIEPEIFQALREARVGSFPQEPAFGSPAAVAQAAEILRGDVALLEDAAECVAEEAEAEERSELLTRLDEALAEVERLRASHAAVAAAIGYPADVASAPCDVLAHAVSALAQNYTSLGSDYESAVEQRDALADALAECAPLLLASSDSYKPGPGALRVAAKAQVALRKAGR